MTTERAGIPAKYKWDLSAIYPDEAAFSAEFSETERMIAEYPKHESTMLSRPEALAAALADHYAIDRKMAKLYEYAARNFDVDTSVNSWQAQTARSSIQQPLYGGGIFRCSLSAQTRRRKARTVVSCLPRVQKYRRVIEVSCAAALCTSDECEKLLAGMSQGLDSA